jgi:uncharacterized protein YdaU (DUF1376 family)
MAKPAIGEWMPFHGDRFFDDIDVVAMPDAARLLYIVLLWRQWKAERLPAEPNVLAKISTMDAKTFRKVWPAVEPKFPIGTDGYRRNAVLAGFREAAATKAALYTANAERMNSARTPQRGPSRAPSRGPLQDPTQDPQRNPPLDKELDIQQHPTRACARAPATAGQQPQQRLDWVCRLWNDARAPLMPPAPNATPELLERFEAVDTLETDWERIIQDVCKCPALNGTMRPAKGYETPYVLTFGRLLAPKVFEKAQRGEYATVPLPDGMTPSEAAVLIRSMELRKGKQ